MRNFVNTQVQASLLAPLAVPSGRQLGASRRQAKSARKKKDVVEVPAEELRRRHLRAVEQALLNLPVGFDDYRELVERGRALNYLDRWGCFVVRVLGEPKTVAGSAQPRFNVSVTDGHTDMVITVFGPKKLSPLGRVQAGAIIKVRAILKKFGNTLTLTSAELIPRVAEGCLLPKYQTRKSVMSAERIREFVADALSNEETLEQAVSEVRSHFHGATDSEISLALGRPTFTIRGLLQCLHRPSDMEEAQEALAVAKRLAAQAVLWQARTGARRKASLKSVFLVDKSFVASLVGVLPFPATRAQLQVIDQICDGLRAPYPMNMLLSGDVGTGKTAAYMIPAVAAQQMGAKVAVMIPNFVLAKNIESELKEWFPDVDTIFVGGDEKPPKAEDLSCNPIIIGTTAILHQIPKLDWHPNLFITDEQQKTSVEQRARLLTPSTNVLEATATCVPRTKALVEHGAVDVAILNEFPIAKTIHTAIIDHSGRAQMFADLKKITAEGGQVAIIYPLVDGKEDDARKSVEAAGQMWERLLPGQVGVLHGRMPGEEKLRVLTAMKEGTLRVLVASTVIEVGVTIPALRAIMIVHAERYGVSTLHQIRGRVARHGGEGWCFLYLPEPVSNDAMTRLQLLEKYTDGFVLAEKDMQMRGFGDVTASGETQHGATKAIFFGLELMPDDITNELAQCVPSTAASVGE
jgi:ATP-dependent DNA helicase RecG